MMLGHRFDLRGAIDWHRDPRTGHQFPRTFYADVPRHQGSGGPIDVKYVWELGRQQYLVELARGWLFGRDERYAARARQLLLDWIDQNPRYEGIHWTSGLEAAMRPISWIWTLATLREWSGWTGADLVRIANSLGEHAEYLRGHFSFYSSPYNHLIGEATALYLIGRVLQEDPRSAEWRQAAAKVLTGHGPRQFYGDGFCVEQAVGYHYYTLGFLTLAVVAARNAAEPLLEVEQIVQAAYRAGMHFRMPDARWPAIGDVDSARSVPVLPDDFWNFDGLCSVAAVLFGDPEMKLPDMQPGEELFWLLGTRGLNDWDRIESSPAATFSLLAESGYVVGRSEGDWLCVDAGPIAHGLYADGTPSTAHGHMDTLQVLYCHDGEPVLVDCGMPFYFGDREWVRHFRGSGAHNTIEIEGLSPAGDAGPLEWSHVSARTELQGGLTQGIWHAAATLHLGGENRVDRYVVCVPQRGLWIADGVTLDKPRQIRWHWQLGFTASLCESFDESGIVARGDRLLLAGWSEGGTPQVRIERADPRSPQAWQAPGYGVRQEGCRVCEEVDGVQRLFKVFFVGPEIAPFSATAAGHEIGVRREMLGTGRQLRFGASLWRLPQLSGVGDRPRATNATAAPARSLVTSVS
jgi:hypothetical protein